jgi:hypothetical protein
MTLTSITAAVFAANVPFKHIHVVVVARIAHLDIAIEASLTNKLAFVVKTGIAVATQAKLEVFAFFGALFFRKVHEGNMSALFVLGVLNIIPFGSCSQSYPIIVFTRVVRLRR